ncbi:MAG: HK97-gp10 family putative phage morphogenesis protein [Pikeienuella sp.]
MVVGLRKLKKQLNVDIPGKVKVAARRALRIGANELVSEMRRLVPVDQGDLRDSIAWTFGDAPAGTLALDTIGGNSEFRVTIYAGGGDEYYAFFQEFGTKNMAPTPFFYPSYRKLKRRVKGRITREINKAIRSL